MPRPAATFVVPCFNHGRFVREAVESALNQAEADTRVVLVDDGSDDGTSPGACDALAGDRVTVVHQANRGLPGARNRGAREARTEYLVFLDADDYIRPTFVSALHAAILADPDPGSVSHAYCQEELIELGTGVWKVPEWDPLLLMVTNLHPVTALVRRECFESVGGFDETMTAGYEDWEFWLRVAEHGRRGVRVQQPLFVWRRHSHTTMVMGAVRRHDDLYRQIIKRRRAMFAARGDEALVLANSLLRKFDCNWIDESGFPIVLLHLRACRDRLPLAEAELAGAKAGADALARQNEALRSEVARVQGQLADMAASTPVRWRRSLDRTTARLPAPLNAAVRAVLRLFRNAGPGGAPGGH